MLFPPSSLQQNTSEYFIKIEQYKRSVLEDCRSVSHTLFMHYRWFIFRITVLRSASIFQEFIHDMESILAQYTI